MGADIQIDVCRRGGGVTTARRDSLHRQTTCINLSSHKSQNKASLSRS